MAHYSRRRAFLAPAVESLVFTTRTERWLGLKLFQRQIGFLFIVNVAPVERLLRERLLDPYIDRLTT